MALATVGLLSSSCERNAVEPADGGADLGGAAARDGGVDATPALACGGIVFGRNTTDVSGCVSGYSMIALSITSASPRDDVRSCYITIADENGTDVVPDYELDKEYTMDSAGNLMLKFGCESGLTQAQVGTLYFATSKLVGSLRFQAVGRDERYQVVQTGSATLEVIRPHPPTTTLTLAMARVPLDGGWR